MYKQCWSFGWCTYHENPAHKHYAGEYAISKIETFSNPAYDTR